jgi:hypothetical protein
MPLYYDKNHNYSEQSFSVFYAHIPKCAGTYIKECLLKSGLTETLESRDPPSLFTSLQHLEYKRIENLINLQAVSLKFAFIRHPHHRILSEYFYINKISYLPNSNLSILRQNIEEWIINHSHIFNSNNYILDNHLLPQHLFFTESFKIYKIENGISEWVNDYNSIAPKSFLIEAIYDKSITIYDETLLSTKALNVLYKMYKEDLIYYE